MDWRGFAHIAQRALDPQRLLAATAGAQTSPAAWKLTLRNLASSRPVVGDEQVVVSLTSYGRRLNWVHLAIESIGRGKALPRRLILWSEDADFVAHPPDAIARLVDRGLEVIHTEDWGAHKKYFPYALSEEQHRLPLVTADDDVIYGDAWLAELLDAHRAHPEDVVAHRAHRMLLQNGRIAPYALWQDLDWGEAGPRTFATGISGVLYPPAMLDGLRGAGDAFLECAPRADDVWLHAQALRQGRVVRPVRDGLTVYPHLPGSATGSLALTNVWAGGNDEQIAATYRPQEVARLWEDQERRRR